MIKFPLNEVRILNNEHNGENSNIIGKSRGLKRGSTVACFLGLLVLFPPGECLSVSCECFMLSIGGLRGGPIICREESYQVRCV
jgi:hypothetical protein